MNADPANTDPEATAKTFELSPYDMDQHIEFHARLFMGRYPHPSFPLIEIVGYKGTAYSDDTSALNYFNADCEKTMFILNNHPGNVSNQNLALLLGNSTRLLQWEFANDDMRQQVELVRDLAALITVERLSKSDLNLALLLEANSRLLILELADGVRKQAEEVRDLAYFTAADRLMKIGDSPKNEG